MWGSMMVKTLWSAIKSVSNGYPGHGITECSLFSIMMVAGMLLCVLRRSLKFYIMVICLNEISWSMDLCGMEVWRRMCQVVRKIPMHRDIMLTFVSRL